MKNNIIVFIDPPFSLGGRNTPGIAFLRGYLKARGIDTIALNLNKFIDKNNECYFNNELLKILSDFNLDKYTKIFQNPTTVNKNLPKLEYFRLLHGMLYGQDRKTFGKR